MYSILIPVPILARLHDRWAALQQHERQLEQSPGVRQLSHDVSAQPQVWHDADGEEDAPNAKGKLVPTYASREVV